MSFLDDLVDMSFLDDLVDMSFLDDDEMGITLVGFRFIGPFADLTRMPIIWSLLPMGFTRRDRGLASGIRRSAETSTSGKSHNNESIDIEKERAMTMMVRKNKIMNP
jgi:hypothetical protein